MVFSVDLISKIESQFFTNNKVYITNALFMVSGVVRIWSWVKISLRILCLAVIYLLVYSASFHLMCSFQCNFFSMFCAGCRRKRTVRGCVEAHNRVFGFDHRLDLILFFVSCYFPLGDYISIYSINNAFTSNQREQFLFDRIFGLFVVYLIVTLEISFCTFTLIFVFYSLNLVTGIQGNESVQKLILCHND